MVIPKANDQQQSQTTKLNNNKLRTATKRSGNDTQIQTPRKKMRGKEKHKNMHINSQAATNL